jgi:3-hydroxybutyrate dehydrogenase
MLKGKVAVVTGSTSGIGLGIATALAGQGCDIMLNGLGEAAEIDRMCHDLAALSAVRVGYHGGDLTRAKDCADLVAAAAAEFGGCDILINNAGIQHVAPVDAFPEDRWDAVIALNLSAVFHCTKAALPGMKRRGWGRVVNIASVHGLVASVDKAAYVAAKHGVVGLTKVVALEVATTGITCNAICPGWTITPLVQKQIDARAAARGLSDPEAGRQLLQEKQPSLRFNTLEQLGATAVFLCSPAADNITGISLPVDGGWTAQ